MMRDHIIHISQIFLWVSSDGPVAWEGLGLRDLAAWNGALMTKFLWHMHDKKDSHWIRWVHHFYIKKESMWTWNPLKSASPMIKYLMSIRDKLVINCGTIDKAKSFTRLVISSIGDCEPSRPPPSFAPHMGHLGMPNTSLLQTYDLFRPRVLQILGCESLGPLQAPLHLMACHLRLSIYQWPHYWLYGNWLKVLLFKAHPNWLSTLLLLLPLL